MTTEALLLPAEVAALLGVTVQTVARWAYENHLPYVRTPSGKYRFSAATLHTFLRTVPPGLNLARPSTAARIRLACALNCPETVASKWRVNGR
jgi:excisionase family DNA binding protein